MSALYAIHGHFYQPAREHPWLEAIEVQDSAAPAHDWNGRITADCYAPNAAARILDDAGRITRIVNNYATISFNFGPTLLAWLEHHAPEVYTAILRADRESLAARGFGNAMAQPYNHLILPLATRPDKITQVRWGIADFARRFGRPPDGMWLPETAVDTETLAVLAECGIRYTVLAPHQAARVRALGGDWVDVQPEVLDTKRPYLCRPGPGLAIAVFLYDASVAHDIAFGPLLTNGEALAGRLQSAAADSAWAGEQLVHVATDGETYGHHHRFGEMALAYAIEVLGERGGEFTNYATFLADHPPTHEVEVHERTAWSCAHGIERWRADCGCRTRPGWHQRWRTPLRDAMDWLKREVDVLFEEAGAQVFHDPWVARDGYIDVLPDRRHAAVERFLATHALRPGHSDDRRTALRLLEMQRHAMLMFSSDGWFFDDLSGVEAVQVLQHAARAIQLAEQLGRMLEPTFLDWLRLAESNVPVHRDGADIYDHLVRPATVDAPRVAAHYGIMSLFREFPDEVAMYVYRLIRRQARRLTRGPHTLHAGRVEIISTPTAENDSLSYAVLHVGGTDVHCCVASGWDDEVHLAAADTLAGVFETGTVTEVIRQMDQTFGRQFYTLRDLFTEERRQVLAHLSEETMAVLESSYRRLYQESRGLMQILRDADVPVPREFVAAAEFVLAADLRRFLLAPGPLAATAWDVMTETRAWRIALPVEEFETLLRARVERALQDAGGLFAVEALANAQRTLDFARDAGISINLWRAQNLFQTMLVPHLAEAPENVRVALEQVAERLHFSLDAVRQGMIVPEGSRVQGASSWHSR